MGSREWRPRTGERPALGRRPASGFRALRLPFVLQHCRATLHLAQPVAIPDELGPDPELRLDTKRRFQLQRRFGSDALFAAEDPAHFGDRDAHALRERRLRKATRLDELLAENLPRTLWWLRCGHANGKNQAMTGSRVGFAGGDCGAP